MKISVTRVEHDEWTKLPVWTLVLEVFILTLGCVLCLDNGLARTPPMGWNTWEAFGCRVDCKTHENDCINEKVIKRIANKLASDGWRDLGYKYVILDDCWSGKERNATTNKLFADLDRFPKGIKALGEYIHSKGLLFGVTLDYGTKTCRNYPGSWGYLEVDANSLAEWEVDFVKMNTCHSYQQNLLEAFEHFAQLVNQTGRQIAILCNYVSYNQWFEDRNSTDWKRVQKSCNMLRDPVNIEDKWSSVTKIIEEYKFRNYMLLEIAGPGHWNDPDMLVVGNPGLTNDQKRVHMGMWCMFAAPLMISTDMDKLDNFSTSLLRNVHLLSIDQDKGGHLAEFVRLQNNVQLWIRKLDECPSGWAIACVNTNVDKVPITFTTSLDKFKSSKYSISGNKFEMIDVFTGDRFKDVRLTEEFTVTINPTGIRMFRVIPFKLIPSTF